MALVEKGNRKPEIEILPVKEGVVAVDDWCAIHETTEEGKEILRWDIPEEDRVFNISNKNIKVSFEKIFDVNDKLDIFYLKYKDSYISKLELITHYINYFIKFYDPDGELLMGYLYLKYDLDYSNIDKPKSRKYFINNLYTTLINNSIYDKVKKMVEDNYRIDLSSTNSQNIKYSESLEFTNKHAKLLLVISVIIKLIIPIILHYIANYKDKKEIHNLSLYYKPLFEMVEEKEKVNLYGKLFNSINVKVNLSESKNSTIWSKYEVEQEDTSTYTKELLDKNIIVDNIFKYLFIKNIIAFNSVIIDTQLDFLVIKNLNINMREISTEKDSEGLSSLDKLEMNTIKIDESLVVLSKLNIKRTIKHIKKTMKIEISDEERDFYKKYLIINPVSKSLIFYFYAKYFDGHRDLKAITKAQYIELMILMKKALLFRGDIYLPLILSASISGRVNARTIHNSKLLEKLRNSEAYQRLLEDKYIALEGMGKADVIITLLSTLFNTQFLYCEYEEPEKLGTEIEVKFDTLAQEFLSFINQI